MKPPFAIEKYYEAMSPGYRELWSDRVQAKIDADIEQNRKADGVFRPAGLPPGAEVEVTQLRHSFVFGAHIFNFDQLGSDERNARYKELYGTFFNSATIAFYWKQLELEEGEPRFAGEYRDSAQFWNECPDPQREPHWRRPAVDPVVDFCLTKPVRLHGHTLVWGNNRWQIPNWLIQKLPPECLQLADMTRNPKDGTLLSEATGKVFGDLSPEDFAQKYPEYVSLINELTAKRIAQIAIRYGDKIDSWDIVNESAHDFGLGRMIPGSKVCQSWYGPMPGDYTYRGFKIAEGFLPDRALLNINDYNMSEDYLKQIIDLKQRGCKIDVAGAQMHLFDPQTCLDIADGKSLTESPQMVYDKFAVLGKAGVPIHLSEITITAPGNDTRGQAIQAVIARNLYRLWFSLKPMMGITWWNVVDGCGAPGEPSVSGLFSRDMEPKPAFHALNDLIYREWMTQVNVKADRHGEIAFRGFRGDYRLRWQDAQGKNQSVEVTL